MPTNLSKILLFYTILQFRFGVFEVERSDIIFISDADSLHMKTILKLKSLAASLIESFPSEIPISTLLLFIY